MSSEKQPMSGSGLYYYGTRNEVRLGDRILIRRFFRNDIEGTVCYIPGVSPRHAFLESEDGAVRQWAYELDDGRIVIEAYFPNELQPRRNIRLISRGEEKGLSPDAKLL